MLFCLRKRYFLITRFDNGAESTIGLIVSRNPETAAKKLGMGIEGHMHHCWSEMPCYDLKFLYSGAPRFQLQELKNLKNLPAKNRKTLKIA